MAKKDKKAKKEPDPQDEVQEELVATTDLEPELEEVQYTDTSYTSASFESLPPIIIEEAKPKPKKKGKKGKEVLEEVVQKTESELFAWSEDSLPEEEIKVEEEQEVKKVAKKGKKKKEKEVIPDFPKPPNYKKMNKKERQLWLEQQIEEWKAQKEAEKQAILAGAKEKREREKRERQELMVKDNAEQEIRRDLLQKTVNLFQNFEKQKMDFVNKRQMMAEWQQYLRCDGLPDPRVVTQMNTYLHLWEGESVCDDNELDRRCIEALPMLEMLEEFVANSRQYTPLQATNYNDVRLALRSQLSKAIECASYSLLRNLEKNLIWESIKLATYQKEFKGLRLNLWVAVRMPTRKPKPVEHEREPVELQFPAINVTVKLPKTVDCSCVCVRASRSMLDLLSETSRSFALAADRANRYEDLFVFNVKEHIETYKLKKEQDEIRTKFFKEIREKIRELENLIKANPFVKNKAQEDELDNLNMAEPQFLPDPRTFIGEQNVELPKQLKPMPYQVQYRAPSPPPPGVTRTPEEIEAEIKKVEAQYEKLALVFIDLPQDVMWMEPPVVCQWQESRKLWTSNYVNDYKYNEDKLTVQFRTGVLWPIGLATLRYSNMPFQGWDLKPDPNGKGVLITVTGLCVTVTWLCLSNAVRLKWIANASTPALKEHFDKPYTVKRMLQIMREAACDFFPDFDGHNHIEGSCPKEWVSERHNYHAMAFLSRAYNFQFSRWNAQAGSRNIIMQIREAVDKKREAKLQLLHVTPQRAVILKCNETSQEFDMEPMTGFPVLLSEDFTRRHVARHM